MLSFLCLEMAKWYVVFKGRVPGVYDEWEDCLKQVTKFSGNYYKGYKTIAEAEARWMNHLLEEERIKKNRMKTFAVLLTVIAVLLYLFVV